MVQAKSGDRVKVDYTGTFEDGTVFDDSTGKDALEFTIGQGEVIPGFEQTVIGMNPGDKRTVEIPATDAYGPHREEFVFDVERSLFPSEIDPQVGQQLAIRHGNGHSTPVRVVGATDAKVTLDANHPLAGKKLIFNIHLVGILPSPA